MRVNVVEQQGLVPKVPCQCDEFETHFQASDKILYVYDVYQLEILVGYELHVWDLKHQVFLLLLKGNLYKAAGWHVCLCHVDDLQICYLINNVLRDLSIDISMHFDLLKG